MVVPRMLKSQVIQKMKEEVDRLQAEARLHFFDNMMYEINDSLTSILAITEMEPKDSIPKIKHYIHRINQSLHSTKSYQISSKGEERFNLTLVLRNLLYVIEEHYKKAKLVTLISDIKAPVLGDQSKFEQIFFYIFVDILARAESETEILVEARQKDQFAMVTILKDQFAFSEEALAQIDRLTEESPDLKGRLQITPQGNGVELIIKIPLQFQMVTLMGAQAKKGVAKNN
ncbi:HAMP domain-containing histidine kinase [Candidatus Peregrinibacteria bacterium]|nr:HAMP domain-containing histidine kinase [Candidatus Peregrinibacteria bacterium]